MSLRKKLPDDSTDKHSSTLQEVLVMKRRKVHHASTAYLLGQQSLAATGGEVNHYLGWHRFSWIIALRRGVIETLGRISFMFPHTSCFSSSVGQGVHLGYTAEPRDSFAISRRPVLHVLCKTCHGRDSAGLH